jgi:hypothetical protein
MQKVAWDADGCPRLGYPNDPEVMSWTPSGDTGSPTGWGDARLGTSALGSWTYNSSSSADSPSSGGVGRVQQTFRGGLNLIAYSVSADVQIDPGSAPGQYGIFGLYYDSANHVEVYIDSQVGMFVSSGLVAGVDQGQKSLLLPPGFDFGAIHNIKFEKTAARQFSFYLDGVGIDRRTFALDYGQTGLFTVGGGARFHEFSVTDKSSGWGDAFGDAAEGLPRNDGGLHPGTGYIRGLWEIQDGTTAISASLGDGWHTLYQGNPNFGNYTVRVDAKLVDTGGTSPQPRLGLIVCHDDRNNQVSLWIDPKHGTLALNAVIQGRSTWESVNLPPGFDPGQFHTLAAIKAGTAFTFSLDGNVVLRETFELLNGTAGVATEDAHAHFQNFAFLHK